MDINNQHTYEATRVRSDTLQRTCFGRGFSIFQFVKNPAGRGVHTNEDCFRQRVTTTYTAGEIGNFNVDTPHG